MCRLGSDQHWIIFWVNLSERYDDFSMLICFMIYYMHFQNMDVNIEVQGRLPLHYAADYGQTEVLEYLLSKGAKVNVSTSIGDIFLNLYIDVSHHLASSDFVFGISRTAVCIKNLKNAIKLIDFHIAPGPSSTIMQLCSFPPVNYTCICNLG